LRIDPFERDLASGLQRQAEERRAPRGLRLELSRARVDEHFLAARAEVFGLLPALAHVRQQPGQQRAVDRIVVRRLLVELQRELALEHFHDLPVDVVPLAHADVRQEVVAAPAAQPRA
jgi:hypothetical protein